MERLTCLPRVTNGILVAGHNWSPDSNSQYEALFSVQEGPSSSSPLPQGKGQLTKDHRNPHNLSPAHLFSLISHQSCPALYTQRYRLPLKYTVWHSTPTCLLPSVPSAWKDPCLDPSSTFSALWVFTHFSNPDCCLHQEALSILCPSHTQFSVSHGTFIHLLIYSTNISKH